tara:strand:+ start:924 stop:1589 length:666 start_codon:yes stop_codon:yes gene_type:complete
MKLVKIGRSDENDIVLKNDLNISRNHCEIFQDDEKNIFLTDLKSANGCFVNGKKVNGSTMLNTNDIVKLGTTVLPWKDYIEKKYDKMKADNLKIKNENLNIKLDDVDSNEKNNYEKPKMFKAPFSFVGRIRRLEYGISSIISTFLINILISVAIENPATWLLIIPVYWFGLAQGAKRCHDRGNSGWFQLIPFYSLWMLFAEGDFGSNSYGPNPKGIKQHMI